MEDLTFEDSSQLVAGRFNAKRTFRYENAIASGRLQRLPYIWRFLAAYRGKLQNGFTLVELLVVVTIIALLVSIAIPQLAAYKTRANNGTCGADLRNLATAMEAYYVDNSTYATATLANLTTGYSFLRTQISSGNACNVQITNQTGAVWTGTSQWAAGGNGTMIYTWNSAIGGMQTPVAL